MLKLLNNRIVFLDVLRAFAVIAMIQGHTVDILLNPSYRGEDSFIHYLWNFNRGITAPIFLFTAGCVFTFVFMNKKVPFSRKPRVRKGLTRGITLVIIGYLIKFPTSNLFHYAGITQKSWQAFYAIDVLQLIGVGLILLLFIFYLMEKFCLDFNRLIISSIIILMLISIVFEYVEWYSYLHPFPAGYLYMGDGAKFPLLPNLVYILAGAVLGSYIALKRSLLTTGILRKYLISCGLLLIVLYEILNFIHNFGGNPFNLFSKTTNMVFIRTGIVLLIVLIIMELSARMRRLPNIVIITGTYTLLIYVVHLFILYGSAWNRGIAFYYSGSLGITGSVLSAAVMIILMVLLALGADYIENRKWKQPNK